MSGHLAETLGAVELDEIHRFTPNGNARPASASGAAIQTSSTSTNTTVASTPAMDIVVLDEDGHIQRFVVFDGVIPADRP